MSSDRQAQEPEQPAHRRVDVLPLVDPAIDQYRDRIDVGRRDDRSLPVDDPVPAAGDEDLVGLEVAMANRDPAAMASCTAGSWIQAPSRRTASRSVPVNRPSTTSLASFSGTGCAAPDHVSTVPMST
jgi:hypothetical protein